MKKITKASAFALITQARNEKKKLKSIKDANETQESIQLEKERSKPISHSSKHGAESDKHTRKRKHNTKAIEKKSFAKAQSERVGSIPLKESEKAMHSKKFKSRVSSSSKEKNNKNKNAVSVMMDATHDDVIEIPHEDKKPTAEIPQEDKKTNAEVPLEDKNPNVEIQNEDKKSTTLNHQIPSNVLKTNTLDTLSPKVIEILDELEEPPIRIDSATSESSEAEIIEISNEDDETNCDSTGIKAKQRKKKRKKGLKKKERNPFRNAHSNWMPGDEKLLGDPKDPVVAEQKGLCCISLTEDALLLLDHPSRWTIKGRAMVKCLSGTIQIMGYNLTPSQPEREVYSPDSNSYVTITTHSDGADMNEVVRRVIETLNEEQGKTLQDAINRRNPCALVRVRWLESTMCDLVTNHVPYVHLFETKPDSQVNESLHHLGMSLCRADIDNVPVLTIGMEIQALFKQWNSTVAKHKEDGKGELVMMLCGSKNTGKSTTNRYLINNALNCLDCVYFLDCDVGQAEFTPPGCVSLVKLSEPVFGPPFTHQRTPECSYFFGGVTPTDNPDCYIECVYKCVQFYRSLDKPAPLIVNTMGWIEDLGFQLLVDTVRMVEPSYLIQLQGKQTDQLPEPLFNKMSWTDLSSIKLPLCDLSRKRRATKQIYINPETSNWDPSKYLAKDLRTLTTMADLCQNLEPGLSVYSVSPYCIQWKDVAVHVCNLNVPYTQIMYSLNANLVALCQADLSKAVKHDEGEPSFFEERPSFSWKGYGIIRGIDPVKKVFYVITSLSSEDLQSVNTLVIGSVTLPEQLQLDQDCDDVPYVDGRISSFGEKGLKPRRRPKMNQ